VLLKTAPPFSYPFHQSVINRVAEGVEESGFGAFYAQDPVLCVKKILD